MTKLLVKSSDAMLNLLQALGQVNPENKTRMEAVFETNDEATARMLEGLGAERLITTTEPAMTPAGKAAKQDKPKMVRTMTIGVCRICGKERELAKDGECKICKMSRAAKTKQMGLPGDEPVVYAGVDEASEVTLPAEEALGTTGGTFTPRAEGVSKAEMRLRENMDRVVEQARARGDLNKLPAQREQVRAIGRKLG